MVRHFWGDEDVCELSERICETEGKMREKRDVKNSISIN